MDTPLPLLYGVHWGNSYSGNGFSGESDWATTKMAHYMQKVQQPQKCPLVVQGKQQHVSVWLKRLFHVWLSSVSGNGLGAFLDSLGWPHRNQPGNLNKLLPAATCFITTDVSRVGHTRQREQGSSKFSCCWWSIQNVASIIPAHTKTLKKSASVNQETKLLLTAWRRHRLKPKAVDQFRKEIRTGITPSPAYVKHERI